MSALAQFIYVVRTRPTFFFTTFFIVVFFTYALLYIIDFYPEPKTEDLNDSVSEAVAMEAENTATTAVLPLSITFETLDKTITVLNPESNVVADLDEALLLGAVRHPDSADFSDPGNIFILGHSSYLPNVWNKNFQAFNGIQNLVWGNHIYLDSADTRYIYRVQKVYKAKASDVVVPFTEGESRLTLATCNSFASKDDRFVVEAVLVDQQSLVVHS